MFGNFCGPSGFSVGAGSANQGTPSSKTEKPSGRQQTRKWKTYNNAPRFGSTYIRETPSRACSACLHLCPACTVNEKSDPSAEHRRRKGVSLQMLRYHRPADPPSRNSRFKTWSDSRAVWNLLCTSLPSVRIQNQCSVRVTTNFHLTRNV